MEQIQKWKAAITGLLGGLTALWGWFGWLVAGWAACMLLDYLTGSLAAAKAGAWSSQAAREGIWHKAGMVAVVLVAAGTDLLLALVLEHLPVAALPLEYRGLICPLVLVWYCLTELGSVVENAVDMGAPCPGWLTRMLAAGRDAVDESAEQKRPG